MDLQEACARAARVLVEVMLQAVHETRDVPATEGV